MLETAANARNEEVVINADGGLIHDAVIESGDFTALTEISRPQIVDGVPDFAQPDRGPAGKLPGRELRGGMDFRPRNQKAANAGDAGDGIKQLSVDFICGLPGEKTTRK